MLAGPSSQPSQVSWLHASFVFHKLIAISQTELKAYSVMTRLEVYKGFGLVALLWCAPFAVQAAQSTLANLI
ncbi:hypothetical protein YB2330_002088 [Saitoella coloradoensis]